MSISHVKVGLPIDAPRGKTRLRWSPVEARRPVSAPGRVGGSRAASRMAAAAPEAAPANISSRPLAFLSARNFFILFAVAALAICLVGLLVRSNHLAVSHSYEISELTRHKMDLLEINRQLKTELAEVGSLENLETAARDTLGLITPRQGQIVVIE